MKNILALIIILFLFSCKKSVDNSPSSSSATPTSSASFSAKINGILMNAQSASGLLQIDTSSGIPRRSFIIFGAYQNFGIYPGFVDLINCTSLVPSNYTDQSSGAVMLYYMPSDTLHQIMPTFSSFKINSVDTVIKKMSGTFSGTMVNSGTGDSVVITNGVFSNVPYLIQ